MGLGLVGGKGKAQGEGTEERGNERGGMKQSIER